MTTLQRQRAHAIASLVAFFLGILFVVLHQAYAQEHWSAPTAILTAGAVVVIAMLALWGLPVRGLRIRRGDFSAEALFQDAPVEIPLFLLVGAESAALAVLGGFTLTAAIRRGAGRLDLLRNGGVRAVLILILAPLRPGLVEAALPPTASGMLAFMAIAAAAALLVIACSVPFVVIHTSLSLTLIWQRLLVDRRLWTGLLATVFWSYAIVRLAPDAVPAAMMVLWLPVILYAFLIRRIDDQAMELHRLRLVRDAVQAMLGARDPLPQIKAILSSIHGSLLDETLSIVTVAGASVDDWRTIASLGQQATDADIEMRRRALSRLKFNEGPSVTLGDDRVTMHVIGIRMAEEEELLGALIVRRRGEGDPSGEQQYADAARGLAPLLRDLRSIALAQSAATTDALTGLKNRAAIMEMLRGMLEDVVRTGAALMFDIDHFKRVNDEQGHGVGDDCLRRIASVATESVRAGDMVGRIGGEEFLIVMPGAASDAAMVVAERLRLAISLCGLRHANGDPVTASLGVATAQIGDTPETLMARADRALYQAKNGGRNRVVESTPENV